MSAPDWPARKARARVFLGQPLKPGHAWSEKAYDYEREDQMYLGWFDDNGKKTPREKITEAMAAYVARFSIAPNIVLVNETDRGVDVAGVTIRVESYIRRNNYWIGWEHSLS